MPYGDSLVHRIREYLMDFPNLEIEKKRMFRDLTFMVIGKTCISLGNATLMCRI